MEQAAVIRDIQIVPGCGSYSDHIRFEELFWIERQLGPEYGEWARRGFSRSYRLSDGHEIDTVEIEMLKTGERKRLYFDVSDPCRVDRESMP
jgi:hypothetical protein